MTSKKNVFIVALIVLLRREREKEDSDFNAKIVIEVFRVKNNYQDFKQNYGMNMFGRNKLFQI